MTALDDQAARNRVAGTGLGETLFVEAGAGTGKTTLLVSRIVNLVLEAGVALRSIAAITFTEAAAAELVSRIRAEFERTLANAEMRGDLARAELCRGAIADADLAAITTLHGFANRILNEFSILAGLPPAVSVLDEVASHLAQEQRWERFVNRVHDRADLHDLLVAATSLDIPLEPRYREQTTLADLAVEFDQNWDRLGLVLGPADGPEQVDYRPVAAAELADFDRAVADLAGRVDECVDPGDKLFIHLGQILPEMRAIVAIDDPLRKLRLLKTATWNKTRGGAKRGWGSSDNVKSVKDDIVAVNEAAESAVARVADRTLMALARLVARDAQQAAWRRRSEGGLEFHDLLVLARDLLRNKPDARAALHDRYTHVLLDEFQDTDPIQIEIATLIATDAHDEIVAQSSWHELPVPEGRLFFVGDPKQSIYRFRRADIALFLGARDRFASAGAEQLTTNFRTVESIVSWVNALFAVTMPAEIPGAQPAYVKLGAHRADSSGSADHRPVLLGGPHPDPKIRAPELRTAEAADIATAVTAILERPSDWPVHEGDSGSGRQVWRPARIDDITILVPARTSLPFLKAALDEAGHRYAIATGTLVYDTQQIADALAALRAVDDPSDEISIVAALRSPLYACSDVDLFEWKQAGGRWNYRRAVPDGVAADHPVAAAFAHLDQLWNDRWFLSPSAMLERLLRERRAALLAFGTARPTDVWRRLRFLVEQARAFEESGPGDLRAFCRWAGLRSAPRATVHEPLLPESDEQALSIRTIHGAKGLEFPITILAGMTTQFGHRRNGLSVLWSDDAAPEIKLKSTTATLDHDRRASLESAMDEHERWRLGYVATTRARDHLIVSCHHKQGAENNTYGGRIWSVFADPELAPLARTLNLELPDPDAAEASPPAVQADAGAPTQLGLPLDAGDLWRQRRAELLDRAGRPRVVSATAVAAGSGHGGGAEDAFTEDEDDDGADGATLAGATTIRRRGRTGTAIGSAVHGVLERVDFARTVDPDHLDSLVAYCAAAESATVHSAEIKALVGSVLDSDAVALAAGHEHHKEVFVAAPAPGGGLLRAGSEMVIEGYVDLLIRTPDGLVVVDYKTDSATTDAEVDAKVAYYGRQAATYAVALETSTGVAVAECRLVFARSRGPAIERRIMADDLELAKREVLATLAAW